MYVLFVSHEHENEVKFMFKKFVNAGKRICAHPKNAALHNTLEKYMIGEKIHWQKKFTKNTQTSMVEKIHGRKTHKLRWFKKFTEKEPTVREKLGKNKKFYKSNGSV